MNKNQVKKIQKELSVFPAWELLKWAFITFDLKKIVLASSLGAEDQVLTHMIKGINKEVGVFTLDTGRLPQETYDLMQSTKNKYQFNYEVLFPERIAVQEMESQHGPNLFYLSVENRKKCCNIRKVEPLKAKLATVDAWICGLRQEQALTRSALEKIEWDDVNGLVKINPLADWTQDQVWDYIKEHNVPYNELHDKGYPSIGCTPCTRAIKSDESIRAGRWWWEDANHKECGLHRK